MSRAPLWPFLEFHGLSGAALIDAYRAEYLRIYVHAPDGQPKCLRDWTGADVRFSPYAFDHAFSGTNRFREGVDHDGFDLERARRLPWIERVLAGDAGTIRRYRQVRPDSRGRQEKKRRTFVVAEERYVVVLDEPRTEQRPFQFVTAFYAADFDTLRRIHSSAFCVETRRR